MRFDEGQAAYDAEADHEHDEQVALEREAQEAFEEFDRRENRDPNKLNIGGQLLSTYRAAWIRGFMAARMTAPRTPEGSAAKEKP